MPSIKLHHVVVPKERLEQMPDSQRRFLVYASHISNELNWFGKVLLTLQVTSKEHEQMRDAAKDAVTRALHGGSAAQTLILSRLYVGKICEALTFLNKFCFDRAWFEDLLPGLHPDARKAREELQGYVCPEAQRTKGSRPELLKLIRDKYAFHYDEREIKRSKDVVKFDLEFDMYLAEDIGNTLYIGSERVIYATLAEAAGYPNPDELIEVIIDECLKVGGWLKDLLGHSLAELYLKNVGSSLNELGLQETVEVPAPPLRDNRLPYFCSNTEEVS